MTTDDILQQPNTTTVRRWLRSHWWAVAVAAFAILEASIYLPVRQTRRLVPDAAVFFLGGDLLAAGYAPYLNLWDVKPPLIYDVTALIALVAPDDPWVQFYIGSALTMAAAVAVVALAGALVRRVTRRPFAAFVACITIIGFQTFVIFPARGIFPKYFTLAFGLAGLWASLNARDTAAAALATVAAGFWQWGLLFVLLVYGRAWRHSRHTHWRRMVLASLAVTAVAVAPIVAAGAGAAMVRQVLVDVFLLGDHGQSFLQRVDKFTRYAGLLWPLIVAGAVGALDVAYRERDHYWILAGVAWAGMQVGFVDFDTGPDLFVLLVFAALGLGVAVGTLRLQRHQQVLIVCLVLVLAGGTLYDHRQVLDTPPQSSVDADAGGIRGAFLGQRIPPDCTITIGNARLERLYSDGTPHVCEPPGPLG